LAVALLAVVISAVVIYSMAGTPIPGEEEEETPELTQSKVLLVTSMGDITIQLRDDMPITTTNFKNLVHQGVYNNTTFHRVIADFMIQGGDPNGNGISDDGIATIQDEFTDTNENDRGTIAMANLGEDHPNSGCSQFFINVVDNNYLDPLHPVFGEVIDGMDVVDAISNVATDGEPYNEPLEEVTLISATLID
jgi:peptidylprolyl isomerase